MFSRVNNGAGTFLCKYLSEHEELPSHAGILVKYSQNAVSWVDAHDIIAQYMYEEETKFTKCNAAGTFLCKYLAEHRQLPSHAHILVTYSKNVVSWIDAHEIIVQYIYEEGNKFSQFNKIYLKVLSNQFTKNGTTAKSLLGFVDDTDGEEKGPVKQMQTDTLNCPIKKCAALNRVAMVLHFYETTDIDNTKELVSHCTDTYSTAISDYHHLISEHLNCNDITQQRNYLFIQKRISKFIKCDANKCNKSVQHNLRDIEQDTNQFYIDLLDTMHCYFIHKYNVLDIIDQYKSNHIDINEQFEKTSVYSEETNSKYSEATTESDSYSDTDASNTSYSSSSIDSENYKTNLKKVVECFYGNKQGNHVTRNEIKRFLDIVEITEHCDFDQVFSIKCNDDIDKVSLHEFVEFLCDENMNSKANDIKKHIEKHTAWKLLLKAVELFEKLDVDNCGHLEYNKFKQFGKKLNLNDKETEVLWMAINTNQTEYITIVELFEWLKSKMEIVKHVDIE